MMRLNGYAAIFGEPTQIGGILPFTEIILPGAFRKTLQNSNPIRFIHHHDWRTVLASTSNGTLKLHEDKLGLHFDATLPDTTAAHDLHKLVNRRDIEGMSFAFFVSNHSGEAWNEDAAGNITRKLIQVNISEITLTPIPAYPGTIVNARSDASNVVEIASAQGRNAVLIKKMQRQLNFIGVRRRLHDSRLGRGGCNL